jgi:hypothetical protein
MPVVKLTLKPDDVTPVYLMRHRWAMEILAHSLFPEVNASATRSAWVDSIMRRFARDWTTQICPLPSAVEMYRQWFGWHAFSLTPDEGEDLKSNDNRDLRIAARILIDRVFGSTSKAKAAAKIAFELRAGKRPTSSDGDEGIVKRAWRKYANGSHFVASYLLLEGGRSGATRPEPDDLFLEYIALAEHIRVTGENTVPPHGSTPVLDAGKTWKMPETFPLLRVNVRRWQDGTGAIEFAAAELKAAISV